MLREGKCKKMWDMMKFPLDIGSTWVKWVWGG